MKKCIFCNELNTKLLEEDGYGGIWLCQEHFEEYVLLLTDEGRRQLNSEHIKKSHRNYKLGALGQATLNKKAKRRYE